MFPQFSGPLGYIEQDADFVGGAPFPQLGYARNSQTFWVCTFNGNYINDQPQYTWVKLPFGFGSLSAGANQVLAGPDRVSGTPTFRLLLPDDIPSTLNATQTVNPGIADVSNDIATTYYVQNAIQSPQLPEPANRFLGGPTSGGGANPTFRVLVANDIPTVLNATQVPTPTTGDNSTNVATTAFVQNAVSSGGGGLPTGPEPPNTVLAGPTTVSSAELIQQNSNFNASTISLSLAYPSNNTAGNLLIACIWVRTTPTAPTVTDTQGNTWNKAVGWTGGVLTSIWYTYAKAGANTVTYNDPGVNNHVHLVIEEVFGVVPSGLDQSGVISSGLTVTTAGSVSQANEWVVGALGGCCGSVANPIVPPTTATQDAVTNDTVNVERITVAHLTATTGLSGAQSMTFSSAGTNGTFLWGCIATFKAGPIGVPPTFRQLTAADIQPALSTGAYRLNRIFMITASGTYTPTTGTRALYVECIGGGGAGSGAASTTSGNMSVSSGGGSGAYSAVFLSASIKGSYTVVVGVGGTVGASGAPGNSGNDTTFDSPSVCTAKGGSGSSGQVVSGSTVAVVLGGAGGAASSGIGDFKCDGSDGGIAVRLSGSVGYGGMGGAAPLGAGSSTTPAALTLLGVAGKLYGGGGSGENTGNGSGPGTGGAGANGVIRVWEFM